MKRLLLVLVLSWLVACQAGGVPTPTPSPAFPAPDFNATALDGTRYSLQELRGRWVILNFWASWCEPCVEEMPALQGLADRNPDSLVVLGINMREPRQTVAAFSAEHGIRFPLLVNPEPTVLTSYQVVGLPQTVLVDRGGNITYRQFGPIKLPEFERLLAELAELERTEK